MERIIAIMIILAVAITLTLAGIAWIRSVMDIAPWNPDILRIEAEIEGTAGEWELKIRVANMGSSEVKISRVEVVEKEAIDLSIAIEPGEEYETSIQLKQQYTPNTIHTIRLYLNTGTVYIATAKTKQS